MAASRCKSMTMASSEGHTRQAFVQLAMRADFKMWVVGMLWRYMSLAWNREVYPRCLDHSCLCFPTAPAISRTRGSIRDSERCLGSNSLRPLLRPRFIDITDRHQCPNSVLPFQFMLSTSAIYFIYLSLILGDYLYYVGTYLTYESYNIHKALGVNYYY